LVHKNIGVIMAERLENGNIIIPVRAETGGVIGDYWKEITPEHKDYLSWDKYLSLLDGNAEGE